MSNAAPKKRTAMASGGRHSIWFDRPGNRIPNLLHQKWCLSPLCQPDGQARNTIKVFNVTRPGIKPQSTKWKLKAMSNREKKLTNCLERYFQVTLESKGINEQNKRNHSKSESVGHQCHCDAKQHNTKFNFRCVLQLSRRKGWNLLRDLVTLRARDRSSVTSSMHSWSRSHLTYPGSLVTRRLPRVCPWLCHWL